MVSDNYMIINPNKCKNSDDNDTLSWNEFNLENSDYGIILGIRIDRKLTFNKHIKNLCKVRSKTMRTSKNITIS